MSPSIFPTVQSSGIAAFRSPRTEPNRGHRWPTRQPRRLLMLLALATLLPAACARSESNDSGDGPGANIATIVATTDIWADVTQNIACDGIARVVTLTPPGTDPHTYEPSLADSETMANAGLVVANGLGLEATAVDTLEAVEKSGTPIFRVSDHLDAITSTSQDEDHDDEGTDEHDHAGAANPHIWFDPIRVVGTLDALAAAISESTGIAESEFEACVANYTSELDNAHTRIVEIVADLAPQQRVLVTNHDSLSYFADRYGFQVVGTVLPAATTAAEASIAHLEELAEIIEREGVTAIFGEMAHTSATVDSLASQVGDIEVVSLVTDGLGPVDSPNGTYIELLVTNAETVVAALASDG